MAAERRTPFERAIARRRRSQTIAWGLFLLAIASIFAARILFR